jgi:hypothetical protein
MQPQRCRGAQAPQRRETATRRIRPFDGRRRIRISIGFVRSGRNSEIPRASSALTHSFSAPTGIKERIVAACALVIAKDMSRNILLLLFRATVALALLVSGGVLLASEAPVDFRLVRGNAVFTPMPKLSARYAADAWCVADMVVNPTTGAVTDVRVAETSGDPYITYKIVQGLRRWKFRAGTPGLVRVSFGIQRRWPRH